MKNILILSEHKKWKSEIIELLKKDKERYPIQWTFTSTRSDVISELSMHTFDAIILNSGLPVRNLEIIFKYLASNEYKNVPLFFISKTFSDFDELLKQTQFQNLHLVATPAVTEQVVKDIQTAVYPTVTNDGIDTQIKINLEFLKTFIDATKFIMESFCSIKNVKHNRPYLYKPEEANDLAIEGKIVLKSSFFEGEFIIGFSKSAYLSILKIVLAQDDKEITKDNEDFAGEIVNMVYGQAKTVLNQSGHNFEKVLPTYHLNPLKHHTKNPIVVVPLESEVGIIELLIEVSRIQNN